METTVNPVLIAALSGRALAQSARRAGFAPFVVDAFGDEDTIAAAEKCIRLPSAARRGFAGGPLFSALNDLISSARAPIGLVLGAGFEDDQDLIRELEKAHRLLGCGWRAIQQVKHPITFFAALHELGVPHPETRFGAPAENEHWLKKQIGGSGGTHVTASGRRDLAHYDVYFQRLLDGHSISLLGVAGNHGFSLAGFSRQWTNPLPHQPFRYGGAVGPVALDAALAAQMRDAANAVSRVFKLAGLVSFDFVVDGKTPHLLEVNPRPGATLDIFDDPHGSLFAAHVAACLDSNAKGSGSSQNHEVKPSETDAKSNPARAAGYLYADRGAVRVPAISWPGWAADRPAPGTRILAHQPIATAFARGKTAHDAENRCLKRLGQLEEMIYGRARM